MLAGMIQAPSTLFKYFPRERLSSFATCFLRFSPLSAFNDPFEGRPDIKGFIQDNALVSQLLNELPSALRVEYRKLSSEQKAQISEDEFLGFGQLFSEGEIPTLARDYFSHLTRLAKSMPDRLDSRLGALCLCENRDSLLMWAHYASSHSGFLVEYETRHSFLDSRRSDSDEFYHLRKVQYRDERPSAHLIDFDGPEMFIVKSRHWEYESEWRIIKPLADADQVLTIGAQKIHLFRHPPDLIRSVTMGARSTQEDVSSMRLALRTSPGLSDVRLFKARPHESLFQLNFEEVD